MKSVLLISLVFFVAGRFEAKPFFKSAFKSSTTDSNIADLRENGAPSDEENQAVPGILQKKIAKILRKIQFISSIANRFTTASPDSDLDFEDFDKEVTTTERNLSEIVEDISKVTEKEEVEKTSRLQNGKYEFSPIGIGIYFMELIGSIVGLIYGATLQVTNPVQPLV